MHDNVSNFKKKAPLIQKRGAPHVPGTKRGGSTSAPAAAPGGKGAEGRGRPRDGRRGAARFPRWVLVVTAPPETRWRPVRSVALRWGALFSPRRLLQLFRLEQAGSAGRAVPASPGLPAARWRERSSTAPGEPGARCRPGPLPSLHPPGPPVPCPRSEGGPWGGSSR